MDKGQWFHRAFAPDGREFYMTKTNAIDELEQAWEDTTLKDALRKMPETGDHTTVSLRPIERLYTPNDIADLDFARDINYPGQPPYTRGIHPTGYRAKPWLIYGVRSADAYGLRRRPRAVRRRSRQVWRRD
jgi:methylmalonyl-CoA mutase N-terminal domain/subunit